MSAIRVVIVDDHEVVRVGLRTLLAGFSTVDVVGEASTVATAIAETQRLQPDVVLLDIRLGAESGFDVCRQIRKMPGKIRVLILTSFADDDVVFQFISTGADGYLLKDVGSEGLIRAIETVAAGQFVLDPAVTGRVMGRVKNIGSDAEAGRLESLSSQERKILALVAKGQTNKEIASAMGLSDKTVKNYFSKTLEKLQLSRRAQAAAFFVQHSAQK